VEMDRIFSYYCNYCEETPQDTIKASVWGKFLRECQVLDAAVGYEHVELLFLAAVGGRTKGKSPRMSRRQFYRGIIELARKKVPAEEPFTGACALLRKYVLPNAHRVDITAVLDWSRLEEAWNAFEEHNTLLHTIFDCYASKGYGVYAVPTEGTGIALKDAVRGQADPLELNQRLSYTEFQRFAMDFGLLDNGGMSNARLVDKFRAVRAARESQGREDISFDEFAALLLACAVEPADVESVAPALAYKQVKLLFDGIHNSKALDTVEHWRHCYRPASPGMKPPAGSPSLKTRDQIRVRVASVGHPSLAPHVEGCATPVGNSIVAGAAC